SGSYDCIVLDHHLGDVTGAELIRQIQHEACQNCPIIMVTGAGSESVAVQALMDGASDYLPKTHLSPEVLLNSIERALDAHRARSQFNQNHALLEQQVDLQAQAIRQSEKDIRALVDSAPMGMGYWDVGMRCRFGNLCLREWFALGSQDLSAVPMLELLGPSVFQQAHPYFDAALQGHSSSFEVRLPPAPGATSAWQFWQLQPDVSESGTCLGFYATVSDISMRKHAQQRVEELLQFSDAVIENTPLGIAVVRADACCVLRNQAFTDTCGALNEWKTSAFWPHIEEALHSRQSLKFELSLPGENGILIELACSVTRFDQGGVDHVLLMTRDITDQRKAHEALISARDSAESAARAKSAFLANMSHEIRTPMNAIVGFSRLVLEDVLPPSARSYIEKLHTSSLALMDILDDVLDYSKIEAGYMHLERTRFDLEDLLQRIADLFQARLEQKKLAFVVDVSPDMPKYWVGDPLRISQVLTNLIGNAIKFTDKGYISVKVDAGSNADGMLDRLLVKVEDTGIGMDEVTRGRLFEAFIQGDTSITRRFGGTGLGLAICKRLVNLMGGEIRVDSRVGAGSCFEFHVAANVDDQSRPLDPGADVSGRRVLLVDGNALSCQVMLRQLRSWKVTTQCASNIATALAHVERFSRKGTHFDALLIDQAAVHAADESALSQLVERMNWSGGDPPQVILLTTQTDRQQAALGGHLNSPPTTLCKPVLASRLLEALRSSLVDSSQVSALHGSQDSAIGSDRLRQLAGSLRGARVLLVEDNELNQIVAKEFLTRCGLQVTTVDDGRKAVALIQGGGPGQFDAVLMDMHMPVLDGLEATRQIKAQPDADRLPIIGMTAAVLPEDKDRCHAAGMVDHIAKPVIPEVVISTLLRWVGPTELADAGSTSVPSRGDVVALDPADIDLGALKGRLHGNERLVWKLLAAFVDQERAADALLSRLIAERDFSAAVRKAHDLKGSAANLGLMGLSAASAQLQQALQQERNVTDALGQFRRVHGQCLQTLRVLLMQAAGDSPR
ncbi:MAG TPA: response regulator, partial [Aquabacterium sp.]|nr:response regulator [Aquabacterium sp.]